MEKWKIRALDKRSRNWKARILERLSSWILKSPRIMMVVVLE